MKIIQQKIDQVDWRNMESDMHTSGYALIQDFLPPELCNALISNYSDGVQYRKTVVMERHRFGLGEYKYFNYPLPPVLSFIREEMYAKLVPVANKWMEQLGIDIRYPDHLSGLHEQCKVKNQVKPTVLILKYGKGGYNTLHQDLYGDVYFPIQVVLFLNDAARDFDGGEFVLVQQNPRAQSEAIVLKPNMGDMLIFTTNFRPVQGSRGYYRVNVKHGVSRVHRGERHTLGIIFHDAVS